MSDFKDFSKKVDKGSNTDTTIQAADPTPSQTDHKPQDDQKDKNSTPGSNAPKPK